MSSQPRPCALVVGIRRGHELPISARMVHTAKVHQLVNHHVIADLGGISMSRQFRQMWPSPTGTPPRPLIADADPRDRQPLIAGELQQTLPELY